MIALITWAKMLVFSPNIWAGSPSNPSGKTLSSALQPAREKNLLSLSLLHTQKAFTFLMNNNNNSNNK